MNMVQECWNCDEPAKKYSENFGEYLLQRMFGGTVNRVVVA